MLGLGESDTEILQTINDIHEAGCSILTIGQYLQPGPGYMEPVDYVTPEKFEKYRIKALEKGFSFVESSPLVRSSFHAENHVAAR
jgi:lipoic acid synthetase